MPELLSKTKWHVFMAHGVVVLVAGGAVSYTTLTGSKARQITQRLVGPLTTLSSGSGRSTPVPMVLSPQRADTPALQL